MPENFREKIENRKTLLEELRSQKSIFEAIELMKISLNSGGKILIFGNGGSATQASHFTAELVNKFYRVRKGMAAISLSANEANVTSIANDFGFKYIFSKQIEAIGENGDLAIGITTSGTSENVLEAIKTARAKQIKTLCLCGRQTGDLKKIGTDLIIPVNSQDTPVIQEIHLFILHTMADSLEKSIFGETPK
jgi:D-sedoheptulose 7-phosphate isomerase